MPFTKTLDNLKELLDIKKDIELASLLGVTSTSLANKKRRGAIPYEEIIGLCKSRGVDLNQVFDKPKYQNIELKNISSRISQTGFIPLEFMRGNDVSLRDFDKEYKILSNNPFHALNYLVARFGNDFISNFNDGFTTYRFFLEVNKDLTLICNGGDIFRASFYVNPIGVYDRYCDIAIQVLH